MANFIMTNWYIKDKTPYVVIGTAGENNATSISIQCDEIIENAEYFLDIGDTKHDIFNTQELTVKQQITPTGETTNILYLKPMRSFLGKESVKLLQVRCEYIDNDEKVTKESNVFHAIVNKNTGFIYKFDIAIFQQYLNKVKELAAKVAQDIANLTLGDLKDTNIVDPTDGQIIKYDAETQKWINGEGGGSGGSSNYNELSNKPRINNVVLSGNKTTSDLGINIPTKTSDLTNDNGFITIEDVPTKTSELTNDSNFVVDAHYVHTDNNYDTTAKNIVDGVTSALDGKVDKVSGKGLSTNDYTNADKAIVDGVTSALESKANVADLASVATSGDYDDLSDKPSINNVVLSGNKSTSDLGINIPTKTSDLTNDSNFVVDANYVHTDNNYTNADKTIVDGVTNALASKANVADLATVATTGDYEDLSNKPSIPDVSNKMDKANPTGTGALSMNRLGDTTVGNYSVAVGSNTAARGYASFTAGQNTTANQMAQSVVGRYNYNRNETLFEVGNGLDTNNRSNAFEVYSDGSLSTDNGTTKVKLEDVLTDSDVIVTQTLSSGTKIGSISVDGISTDLFAPNGGSGSGDMLQSVYDPNGTVADAGGIVEYVGSMGGGIPHYSTMPTDAQLLAMTNKTVFETDGYWAQTDGHGGKYMITTNAWLVGGMLTITDGTTTKYLVALDNDGNALTTCVDPTRYGVRAIAGLNGNLTLANTHATENSDIISRLTNTHMNATIKFPKGYYVFESPLDFRNRQYNVAGVELPVTRTATLTLADYEVGTVLCFPFLTNGQTAIVTAGNSTIENLAIYGNKNTYHFVIDRTKLATAPNEVVTETIAENEGTQIQCKAISKASGGQINNVFVFNFYTGITCGGNTFIKNFYARHVHYGISCANDTKMEGIGGFNVHTLIRITGSLCSVLHERVDSCVHALEIVNGSSHTITDVDGDWCTDSLIAIGDGTTYGTVRGAIFDGVHGRCNTLKSYDSTQQTEPIDVRELADTDGYGVIRVYPRANFTDSRIVANMYGGGNPMDGTSNYLMPDILFTFASNDITELDNLTFVLAKGVYDINEILRIVQTRTGFTARFDDASGVYFIEGDTVTTYENSADLPWITPQDFGAKADGTTDDSAAIQAAFNAGSNIYFPIGTYLVSSSVKVKSNTNIHGEYGKSVIMIDQTKDTDGNIVYFGMSGYGIKNVLFENMVIHGSETYGAPQHGISCAQIWESENIIFKNCIFRNNLYAATYMVKSSKISYFGCRFEATDCGIQCLGQYPCSDVTIKDCFFSGLSYYNNFTNYQSEPIAIYQGIQNNGPAKRWVIDSCEFEYKHTNAIALGNASILPTGEDKTQIEDCSIRNITVRSVVGVMAFTACRNVIAENIFYDGTDNVFSQTSSLYNIANFNAYCDSVTVRCVKSDNDELLAPFTFGSTSKNCMIDDAQICGAISTLPTIQLQGTNHTIKGVVVNAKTKNGAVQYQNATNSYIDVKAAVGSAYPITHSFAANSTNTGNTIIIHEDSLYPITKLNNVISQSVANANTFNTVTESIVKKSTTTTRYINSNDLCSIVSVSITDSTTFENCMTTYNSWGLLEDGHKMTVEFNCAQALSSRDFKLPSTGNIIPINSDTYKLAPAATYTVVEEFVQTNGKWTETKRYIRYPDGRIVNIVSTDPSTDIDFSTLLGGE